MSKTLTREQREEMIGKPALINAGTVEETTVKIVEVQNQYGNDRALIENANGKQNWRNLDKLKVQS